MCFGKGDPNRRATQRTENSYDHRSSSEKANDAAAAAPKPSTRSSQPTRGSRPRARTDVRSNERSLLSRTFSSARQTFFPRG